MTQADDRLQEDPILKPLVETIELSPLASGHSAFTALSRSIISQQLSMKAAQSILSRCEEYFGREFQPAQLRATAPEALRSLGLSGRKASYWHNIAAHYQQNTQFWRTISTHSDQTIIDELTQIKGVGIWTAQMLLIFNLTREDIFPLGDLAIRDAMIRLYGLDELRNDKKQLYPRLEQIARQWSPYRSIASRYLWHWRGM